MFIKGTKTAAKNESNPQEEWHISVIEILELDPWKYFTTPILGYSKVRV